MDNERIIEVIMEAIKDLYAEGYTSVPNELSKIVDSLKDGTITLIQLKN